MNAEMPLSPFFLVAAATSFVGLGEDYGSVLFGPQGEFVETVLREVRGPRDDDALVPWDAAFVHHVGYWSHYDHRARRSHWPLPATASVEELAQFADVSGALRLAPLDGDLFLLWSPDAQTFARTGIVARAEVHTRSTREELLCECVTVEGNSDEDVSRNGTQVLRLTRKFSPALGDRFIRWTALDGREERREAIERELDWRARHAAA